MDVDPRRWLEVTGLEFTFEELETSSRQHQESSGRNCRSLMRCGKIQSSGRKMLEQITELVHTICQTFRLISHVSQG